MSHIITGNLLRVQYGTVHGSRVSLRGLSVAMPRDRLPDAGFLFFGDSFARIFTLVNHPDVGVKAFKGATAKGLTKELNENRLDIHRALTSRPDTKAAVFVFGNVDVHMSHY